MKRLLLPALLLLNPVNSACAQRLTPQSLTPAQVRALPLLHSFTLDPSRQMFDGAERAALQAFLKRVENRPEVKKYVTGQNMAFGGLKVTA